MGRPKKEDHRICRTFSLDPETNKVLEKLIKNLDMTPSKAVKYLIRQAGKDQVLRNIIKNSEVADLRTKNEKPRECTTGYITITRKDGSLFTFYKGDPINTVDQHENDNTKRESVSNEEIDELYKDLYGE